MVIAVPLAETLYPLIHVQARLLCCIPYPVHEFFFYIKKLFELFLEIR